MNHIYLYEGPFEKGDKGYPMIKEAARRYALENDLNLDLEQAEIVRDEIQNTSGPRSAAVRHIRELD